MKILGCSHKVLGQAVTVRCLFVSLLACFAANTVVAQSLDKIDAQSWSDAVAPGSIGGMTMQKMKPSQFKHRAADKTISLDGTWTLRGADESNSGICIDAKVPGSIHTALFSKGVIPDPRVGRNDTIAEKCSYKTWTMTRTFTYSGDIEDPQLVFDGIANRCTIRLNGQIVCEHEGMFGVPPQPVGKLLRRGENTLEVTLHPIVAMFNNEWPNIANQSWKRTVVVNCVYGWHYSKIPSMGIWNNVRLESRPARRIEHPFVITRSTGGDMRLVLSLPQQVTGEVRLLVKPANFKGNSQAYKATVNNASGETAFDFAIAQPQLWYPNDVGPPNLYDAEVQLIVDGKVTSTATKRFGIRTIKMKPFPEGEKPDLYNWTFEINGREQFVKGTGWCTMDALLDLSHDRYNRFLSTAKQQHCQMIRAWGGGLPETETFYNLCDSLGIMVMQEWPTAWNSHNIQPYEMLEETVRLNMLRLRCHPSLVMWGGGNESDAPYGKAIDMMGRYSVTLDGTRPFHRGEPWGGSAHNYNCWWDLLHLNHNLNMTARFWGEFGIPSLPCLESEQKYLDGEKYSWPPAPESVFTHHTPMFGTNWEIHRLNQYAGYFTSTDNLDDVILGSQMAQSEGIRHTLERARTMWPSTTGALYYKLNDNYPGLSWSTVDYYGAIKPAHYFARRAFEPTTTVLLFDRTNMCAQDVSLPYFILDDNETLAGKEAKAHLTVWDNEMDTVADTLITVKAKGRVMKIADVTIPGEFTDTQMLWFKTDLFDSNGALVARNWYFANYDTRHNAMLKSYRAQLAIVQQGDKLTLTNTSDAPAVGVTIEVPGESATLTLSDNYLWIDPGETVTVTMNTTGKARVTGWNLIQ